MWLTMNHRKLQLVGLRPEKESLRRGDFPFISFRCYLRTLVNPSLCLVTKVLLWGVHGGGLRAGRRAWGTHTSPRGRGGDSSGPRP